MADYTVTIKVDSTGVGHTCAGLTVDKINVVLPVVMGFIPFKCSGMTGDDLAIGNNRNVRWVDVNADDPMGMFSGYAVAIALQMNQAG